MRGIAALSILLYHVERRTHSAGEHLNPPLLDAVITHLWLGVSVFFVLSGFLLYRPFAAATLHGAPWPSLRRYARSRVLRIIPAYWAALIAVAFLLNVHVRAAIGAIVVVLAVAGYVCTSSLRGRLLLCGFPVACLIAFVAAAAQDGHLAIETWRGLRHFLFLQIYAPEPYTRVIGPAWTLCIEMTFYAVLPALAFGIHQVARRGSTPRRRFGLQVALLAALIPVGISYQALALPGALPGYVDQFAIGMLLASAFEQRAREAPLSRRAVGALISAAGTLFLVATLMRDLEPSAMRTNGSSVFYQPLFAGAVALILASALMGRRRSLLSRLLASRPLTLLGLVSYGIFLWHDPILLRLQAADLLFPADWYAANVILLAGVTVAVATASWQLLEKRALALKDWAPRGRSRGVLRRGAAPIAETA